jgi:hypothetical protein
MTKPVLMVVDDDETHRQRLRGSLHGRFGGDYDVITQPSVDHGRSVKRVASAVGAGYTAVQFVHEYSGGG